ncbi:hypothetical protein WA026_018764 [Henosepilachna vigintioctopunctata]|uniref:Translation initiation factor eIF2B subunit beta n=1 Tax=Henosepilachna vigintioctopunctata TaxID=420089 RepID=A0AAW1TWX0_9CUCU
MATNIEVEHNNEDTLDVMQLISDIKHSQLINSYNTATRTVDFLKSLISEQEWTTAQELMDLVKKRMKIISTSLPYEVVSLNILRHSLKLIREEYRSILKKKKGEDLSPPQFVTPDYREVLDYSETLPDLKARLLDQLTEYKVEMETSCENIANQASEHIHTNETVLTVGRSHTVERFLISAAKKTTFEVIVAESSNILEGHTMANNLAEADIGTTLIPDTNVFALMPRVNKVIIGTDTVMANGGLRAQAGLYVVALAAQHYSVPFMALAHMYKFTPVYVGPHDKTTFDLLGSPADVLPYSSGPMLNKVKVFNPVFDYIPPELVTLIITQQGGNAPSYVYRILTELYVQEDYDA